MNLTERIAQLAPFGTEYFARPLKDDDRTFSGSTIARYENGLEYIEKSYEGPKAFLPSDPLYRVLEAEIGARWMGKLDVAPGCAFFIKTELHIILDFEQGMRYSFQLPDRKHLDPAKNSL